MAAAEAVVVCQIKPMQLTDVRPFNALLHEYLRGVGGFGCQTQVRMEFLKKDGYHVLPQFDSVIDRTYACALQGVPVPCPTPEEDFVPDYVRRRSEKELVWQEGMGGLNPSNRWKWQCGTDGGSNKMLVLRRMWKVAQ